MVRSEAFSPNGELFVLQQLCSSRSVHTNTHLQALHCTAQAVHTCKHSHKLTYAMQTPQTISYLMFVVISLCLTNTQTEMEAV